MTKERFHLPDTIRGITILSMILYHGAWDLVYIAGMNWPWYRSRGAMIWQQSICWTFIFLSGFCTVFSRKMLRRGRTVFLCGVLVSAVTCLFMWEERIVFGVLTFHGAAMLLTWAAKPLLERVPDTAGILANAAAFYVTKGINEGYLQAGSVRLALPAALYRNYLTTFAGFPFPGFYSTDYFSLIPWIFLFLCGFYTARLAKKRGWLESPCMYYNIPVFSIMGRHSLLLYLVHQPVLYLLLQAVMAAGIL